MNKMASIASSTLIALAAAGLASGCTATSATSAASAAKQAAGTSTDTAQSTPGTPGTPGTPARQSPGGPPAGVARSAAASSPVSGAAPSCSPGPSAASGPAPALTAIQFVDPSHGWVVGAGRILATGDGGRTWTRQYHGPADLGQVDFTDRQHGWAVGGDTVLRTINGGATWTALAEPCSSGLVSVHFVSPAVGYAVRIGAGYQANAGTFTPALNESLVRTTDGGATWATVGRAPRNPQSACFANARDGYVGTPGHIWRSTNGGLSWGLALSEPQPSSGSTPVSLDTPEIECAGASAAWVLFLGQDAAMEHGPYLAYTSPDGRDWHALFEEHYTEPSLPGLTIPEGPGPAPGPFSAINSSTAAFVGYSAVVGYGVAPLEMVSDGGRILTREGNVGTVNESLATAFLSSARGWVVGENLPTRTFSIEATSNSGRTWTTQYTTG